MEKLVVWIIIGIFYYIFKTIQSLAGPQKLNRPAQYTPPDLSRYKAAVPKKNIIISSESQKINDYEAISTIEEYTATEVVDDSVEEAPDAVIADPYSVEQAIDSDTRENVDENIFYDIKLKSEEKKPESPHGLAFEPKNIMAGIIWKEILNRPRRRKR